MRITNEADYAIRIICFLASNRTRVGAKEISQSTGVSLRFALKILRKLILAELVTSFKGVNGGYILIKNPSDINLKQIIEIIDGPIRINSCLASDFECNHPGEDGSCNFKSVFEKINSRLISDFSDITFETLTKDYN